MNSNINLERDMVTDQVLRANTLPEIEAAKLVLRAWMKDHPEEQGMREGFEQLYTIQEIIEDEEAGRTYPVRQTAAAA